MSTFLRRRALRVGVLSADAGGVLLAAANPALAHVTAQPGQAEQGAVNTVTWTADPGIRIGPGEFADFPLSLGPLPEVDRLVLPAVQTYDDGEVVAWDQQPLADGAEPEGGMLRRGSAARK